MDIVQDSVDAAPGHLKHHMQTIATLDNVPRKPKQFKNFAANSLNIRGKNGEALLGEIWDFLKAKQDARRKADEQAKVATTTDTTNNQEPTQQSEQDTIIQPTKEQPESRESASTSTASSSEKKQVTSDISASRTKAVKKAMKVALKQAKQNRLTMKKLKKAIRKDLGKDAISKDDAKTLVKQLASSEQKLFTVEGKTVTLKLKD